MNDDDHFAERLAAIDEDLSQGTRELDPSVVTEDARLASACAVLERLEAIWPRRRSNELTSLPEGFARFRLIRVLGVGGFGIVYLAHDERLGREVALKMPRPEMLLTSTLRERFLREARAAAQLQHPNIVPIFDSGEIGSFCFLVAAYCAGGNLADWLRKRSKPLPCATAAEIVRRLADAVHHAHQRGILHRDLKPANILLTPLARGEALPEFPFSPHVADFGLAKAVENTEGEKGITRSGAFLGTPAYMAPEQAHSGESVTVAADVYALGAILYEMLLGQAPFRASSDLDVLRQVVDSEPTRPRQHRGDIPRDLEAICLKCLEKSPERRYVDAATLSADLGRFLENKPTIARPLNWRQRTAKAVRRRPYLSTSLLGFAAVLLAAIGGLLWHLGELESFRREREAGDNREKGLTEKARESEELAKKRKRQVRLQSYVNSVGAADGFLKEKRFELARSSLIDQTPKVEEEDLRDFAWRYLWRLGRNDWPITRLHKEPILALAYSADGKTLHSVTRDNWLQKHDLFDGKLLAASALPSHFPYPLQFRFSRGGNRVAVQSFKDNHVRVAAFETASQRLLYQSSYDNEMLGDFCFSPDGARLIFSDTRQVFLLDIEIQEVKRLISSKLASLRSVAYSPDGESVAVTFHGLTSHFAVHHLKSGKTQSMPGGLRDYREPNDLLWAPDGKTLACWSHTHDIALLDAQPLQFRCYVKRKGINPVSVRAFSPDGKHLAVVESLVMPERDRVSIVRTSDGTALPHLFDSKSGIQAVQWSATDDVLAIAGDDHHIHLWRPFAPHADRVLPGHQPTETWGVAFSTDGKTLASVGDDHMLRFWDPITGERRGQKEGHASLVSCLAYSPNSKWLATGSYDKSVRLCDAAKPAEETHRFRHEHHLRSLAFSHDSKLLASGGRDFVVRLWNPETGEDAGILEGHKESVQSLAFHPLRKLLASASNDYTVRVWDADSRALLHTLAHGKQVWSVAFSPDGTTLASGGEDGAISFWSVADGKLVTTIYPHAKGVRSLAFSPDGKILASGGQDQTVRLFNAELHQELFAFPPQTHEVNGVAFSPDGTFLAAALHDGTISVWHGPK